MSLCFWKYQWSLCGQGHWAAGTFRGPWCSLLISLQHANFVSHPHTTSTIWMLWESLTSDLGQWGSTDSVTRKGHILCLPNIPCGFKQINHSSWLVFALSIMLSWFIHRSPFHWGEHNTVLCETIHTCAISSPFVKPFIRWLGRKGGLLVPGDNNDCDAHEWWKITASQWGRSSFLQMHFHCFKCFLTNGYLNLSDYTS